LQQVAEQARPKIQQNLDRAEQLMKEAASNASSSQAERKSTRTQRWLQMCNLQEVNLHKNTPSDLAVRPPRRPGFNFETERVAGIPVELFTCDHG
jgi:hypothetical protein